MGALDTETGSLKSGVKCVSKALKWAIVGGLFGVGAVVATLVGLHVSGKLGNDEPLGSSLSEPMTGLTDSFQDVSDNLVDTGSELVAGVKDSVADLGETALGQLQEVVPKSGELLHNVGQAVKDGMDSVGDGIKTGMDTVGDGIKDGMDTVGDGIKDGMDTVGDNFKEVVDHAGDVVKKVMSNIGDGVKDIVGKAGETAQDIVGNSEDDLQDVMGKAGDSLGETIQNVGNAVRNLNSKVADKLDDDDLGDGLTAVNEAVKEGVDTLKDSVSSFFDGGGGINELDQRQLASLMMASVLGSSWTLSQQGQAPAVSYDGGNPYNGMAISRQPPARTAPLMGGLGSNPAPLELAMLTMEDGLAETLDGEMDLSLDLK